MNNRQMSTWLLAVTAIVCYSWIAQARGTKGPTSQFLQKRSVRLKTTARVLHKAGIPGYAVNYTRKSTKIRPEDRTGAMVVTAVTSAHMNKWVDKVGKRSIGFICSEGVGATGSSSGYLRIGSEYMDYNWVRANGGTKTGISGKTSTLTEATFLVNSQELRAFKAFYYARNLKLFKDSKGNIINPGWNNPGKSNLKVEGCAGASSSSLNPGWIRVYSRNLRAIQAYGREHNIPALAEAPDNAPRLISNFVKRTGAKQQTDPRVMVRHHATSADMITVFNQGHSADPMVTLKWNRNRERAASWDSRKWAASWTGMGYNHTIFDKAQGDKTYKTWSAKRMSLSDFAGPLTPAR